MNIIKAFWAWLTSLFTEKPTMTPKELAKRIDAGERFAPAAIRPRADKIAQTPADYDPPQAFSVTDYLDGLNSKQLMDIEEYGPDVPKDIDAGVVKAMARARLKSGNFATHQDTWSGLDKQRYNGIMQETYSETQAEQVLRTNATRLNLTRDTIPAEYIAAWDKAQTDGMGR